VISYNLISEYESSRTFNYNILSRIKIGNKDIRAFDYCTFYIVGKDRRMGATNIPMTVAIAYPNTPVKSAGNINTFHFLLEAMAAAVVGPPTLALDATAISRNGILNK
jgi:hypothetical protein